MFNRENKKLIIISRLIILIVSVCVIFNGCKNKNSVDKSNTLSTKVDDTLNINTSPIIKENDNSYTNDTSTIESSITSKGHISDIKIDGIYKMNIIGEIPTSIGLKSTDKEHTLANLGILQGNSKGEFGFAGRLFYKTDTVSGFKLGGNTSILDSRLVQNVDYKNPPDTVDINKLVVVFYQHTSIETPPKMIAYSKVVDMKHRENNISEIRFGGKVTGSDIIADIVAVTKKGNNYYLVSNSMSYSVVGNLPKEMLDAAIEEPKDEFPSVDIKRLFVAYMSFVNLSELSNYDKDYSINVITYSPIIGGEPVNMDEQGLDTTVQ